MADNFEGHFNWNLDSDVARIDRNRIEEKLLARIESDVTLKGKRLLLLSYMYAKHDVMHGVFGSYQSSGVHRRRDDVT